MLCEWCDSLKTSNSSIFRIFFIFIEMLTYFVSMNRCFKWERKKNQMEWNIPKKRAKKREEKNIGSYKMWSVWVVDPRTYFGFIFAHWKHIESNFVQSVRFQLYILIIAKLNHRKSIWNWSTRKRILLNTSKLIDPIKNRTHKQFNLVWLLNFMNRWHSNVSKNTHIISNK